MSKREPTPRQQFGLALFKIGAVILFVALYSSIPDTTDTTKLVLRVAGALMILWVVVDYFRKKK